LNSLALQEKSFFLPANFLIPAFVVLFGGNLALSTNSLNYSSLKNYNDSSLNSVGSLAGTKNASSLCLRENYSDALHPASFFLFRLGNASQSFSKIAAAIFFETCSRLGLRRSFHSLLNPFSLKSAVKADFLTLEPRQPNPNLKPTRQRAKLK
jgi:hypothetical protein